MKLHNWQLSLQFPCGFEFNERFLIKMHEHVYSSQFGTFVGNCQKERIELKFKQFRDVCVFLVFCYVKYLNNNKKCVFLSNFFFLHLFQSIVGILVP